MVSNYHEKQKLKIGDGISMIIGEEPQRKFMGQTESSNNNAINVEARTRMTNTVVALYHNMHQVEALSQRKS